MFVKHIMNLLRSGEDGVDLLLPDSLLCLKILLFSHSVMSYSLWPRGLQHTRIPCPSPSLRARANSCPIEVVMPSNHLILYHPLLLLPPIFPSIGVFFNESALPMSGQSIGASVSASVLPMNIQGWFPLGLTDLISLLVPGTLKSLLQDHSSSIPLDTMIGLAVWAWLKLANQVSFWDCFWNYWEIISSETAELTGYPPIGARE